MAEELNYDSTLKAKEEINGRFIFALIRICKKLEENGMAQLESCLGECIAFIPAEGTKINIEESKDLVQTQISTIKDKLKQETQVKYKIQMGW